MKLEIVDEAKDRAAAFDVHVIVGGGDDLSARQACQYGTKLAPGRAWRNDRLKGRDEVRPLRSIARNAIGRRRTGSQPRVFNPQIFWFSPGARENRHDGESHSHGPKNHFTRR